MKCPTVNNSIPIQEDHDMENQIFESNLDGELVFCKYVIVKGRIILPKKGKCICFRVKKKK